MAWKQPYDAAADLVLRRALEKLQCGVRELPTQEWDARTASIGGVRDSLCSFVSPAAAEWSSVLLHLNALMGDGFMGDLLAAELSRVTAAPSIVFHEYDQVTWGYTLFEVGAESDRFWSIPEAVDMDAALVRGTPAKLSSLFSVSDSDITPYLQHLDSEFSETLKAFPEDEFALSDHWVRVDFMRRLGLEYPSPGSTAGGRYIQIVEL